MKTIKEIIDSIPRQYVDNIDLYPNLLHLFNQCRLGKTAHANKEYDFHMDRIDLFSTREEINKARCKRVNTRNKLLYGKNWFKIKITFLKNCFKGKCNICKKEIQVKDASVDHIIKVADGGTSDFSNLQILCKECHFEKDKDLERNAKGGTDETRNKELFYMKKYGII